MSEVSGERLYTPLSTLFHHILLKSVVPQAMYDEENVIILTQDEHSSIHLDMYKYEEVNKRRIELLKKYGKQI